MNGNVGRKKDVRTLVLVFVLATATCAARASSDSVYVVVHGDTAVICNVDVPHYCNSTFAFDVGRSHDTVSVVECDTARARVRCICTFDLSISVTGLQPGPYVGTVYRRYSRVYGYPTDTTHSIGAVPFVIGSPGGALSQRSYQSPCIRYLGTDDPPQLPFQFYLRQNYPNPFNPVTTINFSVPSGRDLVRGADGQFSIANRQLIILKVFDVLGREVATLVEGVEEPGYKNVQWNAGNVASGMYFYRLQSGRYTETRKLLLLK